MDFAANQRQFLIIKNQEVKSVEKLEEILEKIEKALNTLGEGQKAIVEAVAGNKDEPIDLEKLLIGKAGAKYNKMNLAQLRAARTAINAALAGIDDDDDDKDVKKDATVSFTDAFSKALGIKEEDKDSKASEEIIAGIGKALAEAVKKANEKKED